MRSSIYRNSPINNGLSDPSERRWPKLPLGLQSKLILSFLVLIALALGSSFWLFATQSSDQLTDVMSEQSKLLAYSLSLAAKPILIENRKAELEQIGRELLNTRN